MIWRAVSELPGFPVDWRCPLPHCRERAVSYGAPEYFVRLPGVKGGELPAADCANGHRTALATPSEAVGG